MGSRHSKERIVKSINCFESSEAEYMLNVFDTNGDGELDMEEMKKFLTQYRKQLQSQDAKAAESLPTSDNEFLEWFQALDKDSSGAVTFKELIAAVLDHRTFGPLTLEDDLLMPQSFDALTRDASYGRVRDSLMKSRLGIKDLLFDQNVRSAVLGSKQCVGSVYVNVRGAKNIVHPSLLSDQTEFMQAFVTVETPIFSYKDVHSPPPYNPGLHGQTKVERKKVPTWTNEEFLIPVCDPSLIQGTTDYSSLRICLNDEGSPPISRGTLNQLLGTKSNSVLGVSSYVLGVLEMPMSVLEDYKIPVPSTMEDIQRGAVMEWHALEVDFEYKANMRPEILLSIAYIPGFDPTQYNIPMKIACKPSKPYMELTPPELRAECNATLAKYWNHFRTGDLMLFQTMDEEDNKIAQLVHSSTQSISGEIFTHAAIVVAVDDPNGERKVYLQEALPIEDSTCDSIAQTPIRPGGIFCWDIKTRLDQASACMCWVPLKYELKGASNTLAERFLARHWVRDPPFNTSGMVNAGIFQALHLTSLTDGKTGDTFFCSEFVASTLLMAGVPHFNQPEDFQTALVAPGQLGRLGCFHPPHALKVFPEHAASYAEYLKRASVFDPDLGIPRTELILETTNTSANMEVGILHSVEASF